MRSPRVSRRVAVAAVLTTLAALTAACGGVGAADGAGSSAPVASVTAVAETDAPPASTASAVPRRLGSGESVTLAFGGDVHFEQPIRGYLDQSPASVFAPIAPWLRSADLAMVNLETAISERGTPWPGKQYSFRGPASGFDALRLGGVDVVTAANNHGMDYGADALRDTLNAAKQHGVPLVGAGLSERAAYAPYRVTINGQRIAIFGASDVMDENLRPLWSARGSTLGLANAYPADRLLQAVRQARATSDSIVVYLHWGEELQACPTERQRDLAPRLVAAGADVIVGSHAHIQLGAGMLGKAFVSYGLGNFAFYASRPDNTKTGVLEVTITGRRIDGYRWRPARIIDGRPTPAVGAERRQLLAEWNDLRACTNLRR